ncbi:MAG: hypothetical protein MI806_04870 [Minwuiales bacterium]|nr:hypothetical protein [Minwuiales bacterium]
MEMPEKAPDFFEDTYPRYPFADLVRLGLGIAGWLLALRRRLATERAHTPDGKTDSVR